MALAQTSSASAALERAGVATAQVVVITTRGDAQNSTPAAEMEGEGWFTGELERALIDGRADAAVHSAKDLPTRLASGLRIVALLPRADPRDAAVTRDGSRLAELAAAATVGTSSPRRRALLGSLYPRLRVVPMRGNVDTRLTKLDEGEVDAVLLAGAGLDRLGLGGRIAERLDPRWFVPAPAQGAIALETAAPAAAICGRVDDAETSIAVIAERSVLRALGGGCLLPLGAWARVEDGALVLTAALATETGVKTAERGGDSRDPAALGVAVAELLR